MHRFFQASTLGALAAGGGSESALRIVEPIRATGSLAPLFFVGSMLYSRALVEALTDEVPVYGLNLFGLQEDDGTSPSLSVESIASAYLEEVRQVRPHGPYALMGFCLESTIAYEMARRLHAAGEEVSYLGLIDFFPDPPRRSLRTVLHALHRDPLAELMRRGRRRSHHTIERAEALFARWRNRARSLVGHTPGLVDRHLEMVASLDRAVARYPLPPYLGEVELILASEWGITTSPRLARAVSALEVAVVEGHHDGFFADAQLERLAARVEAGSRRGAGLLALGPAVVHSERWISG